MIRSTGWSFRRLTCCPRRILVLWRACSHAVCPTGRCKPLRGVQHKYPETVLVFPKQGQTCHAYCAYCFRWAQFVGEPDLKMATDDMGRVAEYLAAHREVTSVLIT